MAKSRRTFLKQTGVITTGMVMAPAMVYSAKETSERVKNVLKKSQNVEVVN